MTLSGHGLFATFFFLSDEKTFCSRLGPQTGIESLGSLADREAIISSIALTLHLTVARVDYQLHCSSMCAALIHFPCWDSSQQVLEVVT